jgi:hypothetical protein
MTQPRPTQLPMTQPRLTLLYRYYPPESVVSAMLYAQLAEHFAKKGYSVRVVCANARMRGSQHFASLPSSEILNGVSVIRLSQPQLSRLGLCGHYVPFGGGCLGSASTVMIA